MSTCAIVDDLVYVPDLKGLLYCLDANTGKLYWKHDTQAEVWCSPLVADGKVYLGNYDGVLTIFKTDLMKKLADELGGEIEARVQGKRLLLKKGGQTVREISAEEAPGYFQKVRFSSSIHCTPVVAQGTLYVATFRHLYAIKAGGK